MAMSLGSGDSEDFGEMHEINVTPFIDVMLVLLIIFMVAAPLSTVDIKVDLPTAAAPPQNRPEKPVYVTLSRDLVVSVGDTATTSATFGKVLYDATGGKTDTRIFVRGDQSVAYGDLMNLLDILRTAGFRRVALVSLEKVAN
ncbi:TonB system transport protein ExbD [Novosphingobium album (ex Hu et al. 2023)]|uniref:Biopolymer transport protein ExbD n=1 Tax=Novosphingobium album (ex Hu et al. 2023) TaxID=2930093 RepID=A0ABT0B700_9SPHN|nr:TonB system transport protein ExbD [Novosphingobium album (ex Hu et al. 2023)]MCJ2180584.1 TonB system transport protein ExbD [Novosphingobium album (ex Hu et al. 2023)]